ncbi:hypothetical protein KAI58_03185 [Candidatus Gracilibacteria bacterium]|nr:hypothetical protein [Candidatus Gracilibacteria bacterium]
MRNEIHETDAEEVADSQISRLEKGNSNEEKKKIISIKITGRGIAERVVKTIKSREAVEQDELKRLDGFLSDLQNSDEKMDELFELHFGEEVTSSSSEKESDWGLLFAK